MTDLKIPFTSGPLGDIYRVKQLCKGNRFAVLNICLFLLCIGISVFGFIYLGAIGWPGLHWDAALYGTPVINVAAGKGWYFGSYTPQLINRASLDYDFHGILHVLFYGLLLKCYSWSRYMLAQSCVNALTFVVYTALYASIFLRQKGAGLSSLYVAGLLGFVPGALCIGLQGRPEQLAPMILGVSLGAFSFLSSQVSRIAVHGLILGLLFLLSPLVGLFYASLVFFYWYAMEKNGLISYFRSIFCLVAVAGLVLILLIGLLAPFSPVQWLQNVLNASTQTLSFRGFIFMLRSGRWGFSLIAPFWNLIALLLIGVGVSWLWAKKRSFFALAASAIVLGLFNEKMCDYSYTPFIPYAIFLALAWSAEDFGGGLGVGMSRLIRYPVFAVSFVYMYVVLSYFLSSLVIPHDQLSLVLARDRFGHSQAGKVLSTGTAAVGFPPYAMWPSMVVLGQGGSAYATFTPSQQPVADKSLARYEHKTGRLVEYMIYPQTETSINVLPPSALYVGSARYELWENHWASPVWLDFKLSPLRLTNRYNFALYKRQVPIALSSDP